MQNKLYIWKKKMVKIKQKAPLSSDEISKLSQNNEKGNMRLNSSKLQDLAWSLDVLDVKKED